MAAKWIVICACAGLEVAAVVESSGVAASSPPVFRALTAEELRERSAQPLGRAPPPPEPVARREPGINVLGVLSRDPVAMQRAAELVQARERQARARVYSVAVSARQAADPSTGGWFDLDRVVEKTCVVGADPMEAVPRYGTGMAYAPDLPVNSVIVQIDVSNDRGSEWVYTDTTGPYGPVKLEHEIARANARCTYSPVFCQESQYYRPAAGPEIWVHYINDSAEAERQMQLMKDMAAAAAPEPAAVQEQALRPRRAHALPGLEALRQAQQKARGPAQRALELLRDKQLQASALEAVKTRMQAARINDSVKFVLKQSNRAWLSKTARLNKQGLDTDTLYDGELREEPRTIPAGDGTPDVELRLTVNGRKTKIRATDVFSFENETRSD